MGNLNFLILVKDCGQQYYYFFDSQTPDRQLRRIWRQQLRDPELCFERRDYDFLCERLREHRKAVELGEQPTIDEDDLGKLFDDDPDDECYGR